MAVKANGYITLVRVNDGAGGTGYTVLMSNEAYAFAAGTTAAVAGSTYSNVIAYKNTTQVAATVSKIGSTTVTGNTTGISTGFTGLTAAVTGNGTTSCKITFSATTSLKTKNGSVAVTITVDGKSFVKDFSFSLSLKGDTGGKGEQGDPTGIIESATAPTTKYEGMLWKHTGTVSGLVNGATYRWSGTAWEMFKFRADNIEADSFEGYQFKGAIFRSDFSQVSEKREDNLYHKYDGYIELRGDEIKLSYGESTSADKKTWTVSGMHLDIISSNGIDYRMFNQNGTLIGSTQIQSGKIYCNGDDVMSSIYQLNQNLNSNKTIEVNAYHSVYVIQTGPVKRLCISNSVGLKTTDTLTYCTLPQELRPSFSFFKWILIRYDVRAYLEIMTSGEVKLSRASANIAAGTWIAVNEIYN